MDTFAFERKNHVPLECVRRMKSGEIRLARISVCTLCGSCASDPAVDPERRDGRNAEGLGQSQYPT